MSGPFVSHAQNGEDVVLWRALGHVPHGRYVDVGANHPVEDSVTWAFHQRGWRGLLVDPHPDFAALLREQRPGDIVEEVALSDTPGTVTLHAIAGTGLSTIVDQIGAEHAGAGREVRELQVPTARLSDLLDAHGLGEGDLHFLSVDTEGAEAQVLASLDLTRHRPWVLVVEAVAPGSDRQVHGEWEPALLAAGYEFALFDGLSRFYVAAEHPELRAALDHPACVLDGFVTWHQDALQHAVADLEAHLEDTEARAVTYHEGGERARRDLAEARTELERVRGVLDRVRGEKRAARADLKAARAEARQARAELDAVRGSRSWRLTAPLRRVAGRAGTRG